jgi:hypothetical protein
MFCVCHLIAGVPKQTEKAAQAKAAAAARQNIRDGDQVEKEEDKEHKKPKISVT